MLDQAYRDAALLQMARTEKVYELEELTKVWLPFNSRT